LTTDLIHLSFTAVTHYKNTFTSLRSTAALHFNAAISYFSRRTRSKRSKSVRQSRCTIS